MELRGERDNFPEVVASPLDGRINTKILKKEDKDIELDFERMYLDGKKEYIKPYSNPLKKTFNWKRNFLIRHRFRNQQDINIERLAGLRS